MKDITKLTKSIQSCFKKTTQILGIGLLIGNILYQHWLRLTNKANET